MDRARVLAELQQSVLTPFAQTCLTGVLLSVVAAAVVGYLWDKDREERYLGFWAVAYGFNALRWLFIYPAAALDSAPAQLAASLASGATITLNLVGVATLIDVGRRGLVRLGAALGFMFLALSVVGVTYGIASALFAPVALAAWIAAAWMFWLAHRANPLAAYRIAAGAMILNVVIWIAGYALLGRLVVTSVLLPITILPTMVAFFAIAHQRALAKVRDSEETMRTLFDTVPTPVVISIPPDGRVERINRSALQIFELEARDHIGKTGPESGIIDDLEGRARMYRELAEGAQIRERELPYRTPGGRRLTMSVNASQVETRQGRRYIFAFHDLTDVREVEAALKELNASLERQVADRTRDLESFSYSVSHDLRAPLRAIDGYSAMLADELGASLTGPARDYLARIRENCRRMNALIESLIALSAQGSATLNPVPVDISRLAHEILSDLAAAEPHRHVAVRVEPWMRATVDASALRIVLDNLLRNAWKYTARTAQPVIEVGCETRDGLRVYRVRDNGAGFDMARAGDLFKPFTRLHDAAEFEGTGIGLATVARAVRNMGGRVWAEAKPGEGACFRFTLGPAEARQRGAAAA